MSGQNREGHPSQLANPVTPPAGPYSIKRQARKNKPGQGKASSPLATLPRGGKGCNSGRWINKVHSSASQGRYMLDRPRPAAAGTVSWINYFPHPAQKKFSIRRNQIWSR